MGGNHKDNKVNQRNWFRRIFRRPHNRKYISTDSDVVDNPDDKSDGQAYIVGDSNSRPCFSPNTQSDNLVSPVTHRSHTPGSASPLQVTGEVSTTEVPTKSTTSFKNELALKLGTRPPVLSTPKTPASCLSSGQNADLVVNSMNAVPSDTNTTKVDPYIGVAMQRINLNRQRGPRTPSRYSTDVNATVFDMTTSDISFNVSRDLGRINEEISSSPPTKTKNGDRLEKKQLAGSFTIDYPQSDKTVSRNSLDFVSVTPARSTDKLSNGNCSNDESKSKKPCGLYSKSLSLDKEQKSYIVGSPLRNRSSYHEKSEETLSLTPQTSVSGDGLYDGTIYIDDELDQMQNIARQPRFTRPASMLVPACLRDELHGVVQARISGPSFDEEEEPTKLGRVFSKKHEDNLLVDKSSDHSSVNFSTGIVGDVNRHSYSPNRTSQRVTPKTSSLLVNEAYTPPNVHELIKAFQKASS